MKVRVKTLEEIEKCGDLNEYYGYEMYYEVGFSSITITKEMLLFCGKVIELEDWNGKYGFFSCWKWTIPMLSEIDVKDHNRNGANS